MGSENDQSMPKWYTLSYGLRGVEPSSETKGSGISKSIYYSCTKKVFASIIIVGIGI